MNISSIYIQYLKLGMPLKQFGGQILKFAGHFSEFGRQIFSKALLKIALKNLGSKLN